MVNDVSWSTVILILALMLMHMLTLTVLMYKDGISRYCDGVSTEALQLELHRRKTAKRCTPFRAHTPPMSISRPNVAQIGAPGGFVPDFQPMYDTTSTPVTPYLQWQEPIHSIYGRELPAIEGGVGESEVYNNPYVKASSSSTSPMTCKNNNSFYF